MLFRSLHDIALVKLKETIPLSLEDRVSLVTLAQGIDRLQPQCTVYGWGCSSFGKHYDSEDQSVTELD